MVVTSGDSSGWVSGHVDDRVGELRQVAVALGGDGDNAAGAPLHLFDVGHHLVVGVIVRRHHHHRHAAVDQGNRPVLHLRGRQALGVDVADLLQLERALQGHRVVDAAAQVEPVVALDVALGEVADGIRHGQDALDLGRDRVELTEQIGGALGGQVAAAAHVDRQQRQHGHLAGERLGAGHADLRADVQVHAGVGVARDGGPHHVDDAEGGGALELQLAQGGHRVGGLARLAEHDAERVALDDRIAVTQLAGVLHLGRYARQFLEQVLADQAGVPGGAAAGQDHALKAGQFAFAVRQSAQHHLALGRVDAPAQRVAQRSRLLVDLLAHVVTVAVELDLLQPHLQGADALAERDVVDGGGAQAVAGQQRDLVVVQVDHLAGVLDHRGAVGGHHVLAVADADQHRAAAARGDELVGMVAAQHQQAEGAAHVAKGAPYGRQQVARLAVAAVVVEVPDELRERLRVGLAGRLDALLGEEGANRAVVLDDAVVHHGDGAAGVEVGMGVAFRGGAVGRPAGVRDAGGAGGAVHCHGARQVVHLAHRAIPVQHAVAVEGRYSRRVIAPVLQAPQPGDQQFRRRTRPHVSHDPAHKFPPPQC